MAWQTVRVRLTGKRPLLCHNGQLADPLNRWSQKMAKVSGKRKKTEADHEELARLEFFGGLYLDSEGRPIIPGILLEATLINGAKKFKEGMLAKAGLVIEDDPAIEYDGPATKEKLFAATGSDGETRRFSLRIGVKIGQSKVMRTRPMFSEWALEFNIRFDDSIADESRVLEWCRAGGSVVGLGDWRPRFGLFTTEKVNGE